MPLELSISSLQVPLFWVRYAPCHSLWTRKQTLLKINLYKTQQRTQISNSFDNVHNDVITWKIWKIHHWSSKFVSRKPSHKISSLYIEHHFLVVFQAWIRPRLIELLTPVHSCWQEKLINYLDMAELTKSSWSEFNSWPSLFCNISESTVLPSITLNIYTQLNSNPVK